MQGLSRQDMTFREPAENYLSQCNQQTKQAIIQRCDEVLKDPAKNLKIDHGHPFRYFNITTPSGPLTAVVEWRDDIPHVYVDTIGPSDQFRIGNNP